MAATLAFDVYGTLIDTAGVVTGLHRLVGDRATELSTLWRNKQLEYSFRRGLMQNYADFSVCTRQALDWSCNALGIPLAAPDREELLAGYRRLPAFPEVMEALPALAEAGHRLFAFSNGKASDVASLLEHAGIAHHFRDVISTGEISSFKPNPAVYAHFLRRAGAAGATAWLISSNPFDVIGALSAGMRAAWVRRSTTSSFDPWEFTPTLTVTSLLELRQGLADAASC